MNLSKSGFTIVEIVMIIFILGVLSAVALPLFLDFTADAKNSADDYIIGILKQKASQLLLENAEAGTAEYPLFSEIANNIKSPEFFSGATGNEWYYVEFPPGDTALIGCDHGINIAERRFWTYYRVEAGSFAAGGIYESGPGPHE